MVHRGQGATHRPDLSSSSRSWVRSTPAPARPPGLCTPPAGQLSTLRAGPSRLRHTAQCRMGAGWVLHPGDSVLLTGSEAVDP